MASETDELQGLHYPLQLIAPAIGEVSFFADLRTFKLSGKNVYLACVGRCAFSWIMVNVGFTRVTYLEMLGVGTTLDLLCIISVALRTTTYGWHRKRTSMFSNMTRMTFKLQ
jgi:hypothetical protein